jgi:hypothetical protein
MFSKLVRTSKFKVIKIILILEARAVLPTKEPPTGY